MTTINKMYDYKCRSAFKNANTSIQKHYIWTSLGEFLHTEQEIVGMFLFLQLSL